MPNIIKFNDYVQINPDSKILTLSKEDKIKITDNLITNSYTKGKGLVITYDLSHSGRKINNRVYSARGQRKGVESLTNPFNKPILKHHDQHTDPIGRFIGGEYQDLSEHIMSHLRNDLSAYNQLRHAFDADEPEYMYRSLKKYELLTNSTWPGIGRMRVKANITDEDAIKKFLDGRYLTFSAGSSTNRHVCSICNEDWATNGPCEHTHGRDYDGEMCVFICGDFIVHEGSVVNTPADNFSQLVSIERMTDSELPIKEKQIKDNNAIEIIFTDFEMENNNDVQNERGSSDESNTNEKTNETQEDNQETANEEILEDFDFVSLDEKTFKVPAGAKGNAQKVLDWKDKYGSEVKGMTAVGWARARQLATKSEIGLSTVKRMAMFNRHRKNAEVDPQYKSEPWKDRGYVAWLGWGGTSGIDWAIKISEANNDAEIEQINKEFEVNMSNENQDLTAEQTVINNEDQNIDWFTLDLALTALMEDKALSAEARNRLPTDVFCGPDKTFPVPDCAHVTAARRLINQSKLSDDQKKKVLSCVSGKSKSLECEKSKDQLDIESLQVKYDSAISRISELEEKIKQMLELFVAKSQNKDAETSVNNDSQNNVNIDTNISVNNDTENTVKINENNLDLLTKNVENPSQHLGDSENVINTKPTTKLDAFEQNICDQYFSIKTQFGVDAAEDYLFTQASYLPRGFHPENFTNN